MGRSQELDISRMMLRGIGGRDGNAYQLRGYGVRPDAIGLTLYLARKSVTAFDLIGRAADHRKTFTGSPVRQDNWRNYVPAIGTGRP
jgi:dihydroorotate dehydrogenase (NAD+) catalytic subunit